MRFVSFDAGEGARPGELRGDRVIPLGEPDTGGLATLVRADLPARPAPGEGLALSDVMLLPPIADPSKIVCIGLNYRSHAEEQGAEPPATPTFFAKFASRSPPPGRPSRCRRTAPRSTTRPRSRS